MIEKLGNAKLYLKEKYRESTIAKRKFDNPYLEQNLPMYSGNIYDKEIITYFSSITVLFDKIVNVHNVKNDLLLEKFNEESLVLEKLIIERLKLLQKYKNE